jgi:hypothetical protein
MFSGLPKGNPSPHASPSHFHHKWRREMATIRELESGSWQAIVRRRGIKPSVKTFATKTDANRWARHIESEIDRGVFLDRSEGERTTMGELIDRYLAEVTPGKKSASREVLRLNGLKRHFGRFSLAALPRAATSPNTATHGLPGGLQRRPS